MPSLKSYSLLLYLHYLKFKNRHRKPGIPQQRRVMDRLGRRYPVFPDTQTERVSAHGILAEWIKPPSAQEDRVLYYLHGGGYRMGSIDSHRAMVSKIAQACRAVALVPDYRLAPEHPFPAALDDAVTAYDWLLKQKPQAKIIIAGDSAGGGLALATTLKLREEQLSLPAALLLLAPWVDLQARSRTLDTVAPKDPILHKEGLLASAQAYYGIHDPANPYISPLNADLKGLPPMLIQVGTLDILVGEGKALAQKAQEAQVEVKLEIWKNMVHVWQFMSDLLPEGKQAIQKMGIFVDKTLNTAS